MAPVRPTRLNPLPDSQRDHILGSSEAEMTLVEYGSYACPTCHVAHRAVANLRDRFGNRMRYVFRHRPVSGSDDAKLAAELAEYAFETTGRFWPIHEALMERGPIFRPGDFAQIAQEFKLPPRDDTNAPAWRAAELKVQDDTRSAQQGGARVTPTFFINNRRYEGAWDESALAEAMLGSLGHRLHTASVDFARWAPSTGFLLLLMSIVALLITNSPFGPAFQAWWSEPFGIHFGDSAFTLPLLEWVNHGLLAIFFFVVGLEIKREFTVGHLATQRAAALPVVASFGGMLIPTIIYLAVIPPGPLAIGWGIPIATDTAFAIVLIILLGDRVPVELRVFLTATAVLLCRNQYRLSRGLGRHYLLSHRAQSLERLSFSTLCSVRDHPLGLPSCCRTACDLSRRDSGHRDPDPSSGEPACPNGSSRDNYPGRDQILWGIRYATRAFRTRLASAGRYS